jgi:hemoglobin
MLKDIENREDIILLINTFYSHIKVNKTLGYIFNDVAKVNWQEHLPKMYSFWASILLGEQSYTGNPMEKHLSLSKITPLTESEFNEWLLIFDKTVDLLFEGKTASEAKIRAVNIARLMLFKVQTA